MLDKKKVKEKLDIHFDTIKNNNNISKHIDEEWKIIPDNTDYSVSNYGNVKNNKRNTLINGYKYNKNIYYEFCNLVRRVWFPTLAKIERKTT
jgi:hypothetical protein